MAHSRQLMRYALFILMFPLIACSSQPKSASTATTTSAPPPPAAVPVTQSSIAPGSVRDFEVNVGDTVHFDYDRSAMRDDDRSILQRQAAWLARYPSVHVVIEGHCDERGTRAYNLALGGRRAETVRDYLLSLGVPSSRMTTISYGKERPVCAESTESCWAQNRRAVTNVTSGAVMSSGAAS